MPHINYGEWDVRYNHLRRITLHKTHCCAVMEIDCLGMSQTPLQALVAIANDLKAGYHTRFPEPLTEVLESSDFSVCPKNVIFTGVLQRVGPSRHDGNRMDNYAQIFVDYLKANDLGKVFSTDPVRNFTGNMVQTWVWQPKYDALWPLLETQGFKYTPRLINLLQKEREKNG